MFLVYHVCVLIFTLRFSRESHDLGILPHTSNAPYTALEAHTILLGSALVSRFCSGRFRAFSPLPTRHPSGILHTVSYLIHWVRSRSAPLTCRVATEHIPHLHPHHLHLLPSAFLSFAFCFQATPRCLTYRTLHPRTDGGHRFFFS